MRNLYSSLLSPSNSNPSKTRSLSLLFILDALLTAFETDEAQKRSVALDKLSAYTETLLQASENADPHIVELAEEMRSITPKSPKMNELSEKLCALFHALTPFFFTVRTDENVLMYLLENRGKLNSFLGERTIEGLFCSLFPLGSEELRIILCEGYSRRGFDNIYAEKEHLIDALEWD